jgi:hypothetical protein
MPVGEVAVALVVEEEDEEVEDEEVVVVALVPLKAYNVKRPAAPQSSDEFPGHIILHCESGS